MKAERITFGVPLQATGWQVLASSIVLPDQDMSTLVGQTDIGHPDEKTMSDAYGYFGEFKSWAVFAHFYRSDAPMPTGQHFVQRDICLAPMEDFEAAKFNAHPFLANMPAKVFYNQRQSDIGPTWDLPEPLLSNHPQSAAELSQPVIVHVLKCFLYSPKTFLIWPTVRFEDLTALLYYLPPTFRRKLRFTTISADPTRNIQIQCFPTVRGDNTSSVIDMPQGRIRQDKCGDADESLALRLYAAAEDGTLDEMHAAVESSLKGKAFIDARTIAVAVSDYTSERAAESALNTPQRWEKATEFLREAGTRNAAKRRRILGHLIRNVPINQKDEFKKFFRDLALSSEELPELIENMAERLVDEPAQDLVDLYKTTLKVSASDLFVATLRKMPPERRSIDDIPTLEKTFGIKKGDTPFEAMGIIIGSWSYRGKPSWDDAKPILAACVKGHLNALESNTTLVNQLQENVTAKIALALLYMQHNNQSGSSLLALAAEHPQEMVTAVLDGPAQAWKSNFLVQLLTRTINARPGQKNRDRLSQMFVDHYAASDDIRALETDEVKAAVAWATQDKESARQIVTNAQTRHAVVKNESDTRGKLMQMAAAALKNGPDTLLTMLETNERWAWFLAAALYDDPEFKLLEFCKLIHTHPKAVPLLRMLAAVILISQKSRPDSVAILSYCMAVIASSRLSVEASVRTQMLTKWEPHDAASYERTLMIADAMNPGMGIESFRQRGIGQLVNNEPVKATVARVKKLNDDWRHLATSPEFSTLRDRSSEFDFTELEEAYNALLKTVKDSSLFPTLKELVSAWGKRR